jgi:hypothetical protein
LQATKSISSTLKTKTLLQNVNAGDGESALWYESYS